ncbi:MAG: DUF1761 family protein [candidate division Zixibacteria bacterium]|nr:DUF1761 family protein [candidate division Zixibacteria bacterium]
MPSMEPAGINYLAVVAAAVAYMILGALWYSPVLFGAAWMKGIGKTKEQIAKEFSPVNYLVALIFSFIASYGIARFMQWTGGDSIADGIKISVLAGVAFVLATMGVNDVFENRPRGLTVINTLYHLLGFLIVGIIIGAWR